MKPHPHCHLLLLSPKPGSHFTIPQRVEEAGYIPRQFICPQVVTHSSSNRAQCQLTTLIEVIVLTTTLRCHPMSRLWRKIKVASKSDAILIGTGQCVHS